MLMRKAILLLLLCCFVAAAGVAQETPTAIVTFSATPSGSVTVDAVENGEITVDLNWQIANLPEPNLIQLDYRELNGWVLVPLAETGELGASGTITLAVRSTLDFEAPAFQLTVIGPDNQVLDSSLATIPYTTDPAMPPVIEDFSTELEAVDSAGEDLRVPVSWQISDRKPTSNLVFEQVLPDGTAQSVELPRTYLWVPSVGSGDVAPIIPEGAESITLRLQIVDVVDDILYDEMTLDVPVAVIEEPVVTEEPAVTEAAQAQTTDIVECATGALEVPLGGTPAEDCHVYVDPDTGDRIEIVSFVGNRTFLSPGDAIQLNWEATGADSAVIEMYNTAPGGSEEPTTFDDQPGTGEIVLALSDDFTDGARFVLRLLSDAGEPLAYALVDTFSETSGAVVTSEEAVEAVYQSFEQGFMIWRSDTNEILVFSDDGTLERYPEPTYAGLPDADPSEEPPEDLLVPERGFGKVWGSQGVQEILGWATVPEDGFTMTIERFIAPTGDVQVRIDLPEGEPIIISPNNDWRFQSS
jgi:hypothetical protein